MSIIGLVLPPNLYIYWWFWEFFKFLPNYPQMFIKKDRKRSKNNSIKVQVHTVRQACCEKAILNVFPWTDRPCLLKHIYSNYQKLHQPEDNKRVLTIWERLLGHPLISSIFSFAAVSGKKKREKYGQINLQKNTSWQVSLIVSLKCSMSFLSFDP